MEDKIILVEKGLEETKANHEQLVKYLQEIQNSLDKLALEKEKTIQLIAIKNGEFQAYNKTLQILKTEEENIICEASIKKK